MTAVPPPRTCCVSTTTPNEACVRACVAVRQTGGQRDGQTDGRAGGQKDAPQVGRPPPTSRDDGARADEGPDVVMREWGDGRALPPVSHVHSHYVAPVRAWAAGSRVFKRRIRGRTTGY